jgi:hypothetical protein
MTGTSFQTSNEVLQEALALAEAGYSVFPVNNKIPAVDGAFYAATQDPDELRERFNGRRFSGLAIATGSGFSEVVVIDADSPEAAEWMRERYGDPQVKTRRGGHWYFRHPKDGKIKSVSKYDANKLLDCKGDQGLAAAPPDKGKSWTNGIPDKSTLRVLPEELRPSKNSYSSRDRETSVQLSEEHYEAAVDVLAEDYPPRGVRHEAGLPLAGFLGRNGVDEDDALNIVIDARERLPEPMTEKTERSIVGVIRSTYEKLRNGDEDVTGGRTLETLVPGLAGKLAEALGLDELSPESEEDRRQAREKAAEKAWAVCESLANSDDILSEVYTLQQQDGLVGEEANSKIMQLASVTRHTGRLMSVIIGGESSGGKSYLLEENAKTLPEDAVYTLQSVSDKALAYIGENTLTNKFLMIYELGGLGKEGEQGLEMIKQLLTEGRIDRQIAEGTNKGVQGRRVYTEGPTGLWTTTTRAAIDRELQNRTLTLTIDESPEQTARIIKNRRKRGRKRGQVDFSPIKALHTWLAGQRGDVDVPFEDVIADRVDARAVRMRRFYGYIMELVEAHALLHRARRETDAEGFVLAKPEDYAAVYKLVKDIVSVAAEVSVSESQWETVEAAKRVVESEKPLTSNTLAEELGISRSSASRRLGHAASEGYVKHDPDAKGKTKVYVMGEIQLPDKATPAIPDPEDIWDAMQAAYDEVCKCATCASATTTQDVDGVKSVVNCASPLRTLRAQLGSEESVLTEKPHKNGHSGEGSSHKSEVSYPPVHTLHTCTVEENPSENGSVQDPVHSSEDGDADPLAEWKARREGRILDALADMYVSHEDRYHELPEAEKQLIRAWVSDNAALRNVTRPRDSYELKHTAERFLGFYVSNGSIKGALLEAGYEPAWSGPINMGFRVGPRPGSDWAEKPYGPRVIAPRLLYTWAPIPEYPASRARRQHND